MKQGVYLMKKENQEFRMVRHSLPCDDLAIQYFLRNVQFFISTDSLSRDELQIVLDNASYALEGSKNKYVLIKASIRSCGNKRHDFTGIAVINRCSITKYSDNEYWIKVRDEDLKGFTRWQITEKEAIYLQNVYKIEFNVQPKKEIIL